MTHDAVNAVGASKKLSNLSGGLSKASSEGSSPDDHEAWSTFQSKVLLLCCSIWPNYKPSDFRIEHIPGGRHNRIIGIKISGEGPVEHNYILRIPRADRGRKLPAESATLEYLRSCGIPVPALVATDLTNDNAIGEPWFIMTRIGGDNLSQLWDDLNEAQKICTAGQLGRILRLLFEDAWRQGAGTFDTSKVPLDFKRDDGHLMPFCKVVGHDDKYLELSRRSNVPARGLSYWQLPPGDMLPGSLRLWEYYRDDWIPYEHMARAAEVLKQTGAFAGDAYHLTHPDLYPWNVMVRITSPTTAEITGILDWDWAEFAPPIVSCRAPAWLWLWSKYMSDEIDEEELDRLAAGRPESKIAQRIKAAFEEEVGTDFLRYAYHEDRHEARWIYAFAVEGSMQQEHRSLVRGLLFTLGERHGLTSDLVQPDRWDTGWGPLAHSKYNESESDWSDNSDIDSE